MDRDRYVEGFLAGQAVAYCERVITGMSLAAQLECPGEFSEELSQLIIDEGCKVLASVVDGRAVLWIYRDEIAARLIANLEATHAPSELGIWSMGKLLGYATNDVAAFAERSR